MNGKGTVPKPFGDARGAATPAPRPLGSGDDQTIVTVSTFRSAGRVLLEETSLAVATTVPLP